MHISWSPSPVPDIVTEHGAVRVRRRPAALQTIQPGRVHVDQMNAGDQTQLVVVFRDECGVHKVPVLEIALWLESVARLRSEQRSDCGERDDQDRLPE